MVKAFIRENGILQVFAESELDTYALKRWVEENESETGDLLTVNISVIWGRNPELMPLEVRPAFSVLKEEEDG